MDIPIIISGHEIGRDPFHVTSPFFAGAGYSSAAASPLDIAAAIGCARKAEPGSLDQRKEVMQRAAEAFQYTATHLEHVVWMTGMPVAQIQAMLDQIPQWFRKLPRLIEDRPGSEAGLVGGSPPGGLSMRYSRLDGFCYAVTPGNDPRASALVAANLVYHGIPFILRPSPKDCIAPLVIRALLTGGLDPNACSLLYFAPQAGSGYHGKLVAASRIVWTHGPASFVDERMRYDTAERRQDRFEGKLVIRHQSSSSAAIMRPPLGESLMQALYPSIACPLGCAAVKWILVLGDYEWERALPDWIAGLKVGNPMEPETQIGYIEPAILDYLDGLVRKNRMRYRFWGGERISEIQARPLLAASQTSASDFFGNNVPAYVLALSQCASIEEAVAQINLGTHEAPRLAVSCHQLEPREVEYAAEKTRAHLVLADLPTTTMIPGFHEGNDYFRLLHRSKIVVRPWPFVI